MDWVKDEAWGWGVRKGQKDDTEEGGFLRLMSKPFLFFNIAGCVRVIHDCSPRT